MEKYVLTQDLVTGNELIDSEHRKIFDEVNTLLDACSKGKGREKLSSLGEFLVEYVTKHFSDEEDLQKQSKYPEYTEHHKFHEWYKQKLGDAIIKLEQEGPTINSLGEINYMVSVLVKHIRETDRKLAQWIQNGAKNEVTASKAATGSAVSGKTSYMDTVTKDESTENLDILPDPGYKRTSADPGSVFNGHRHDSSSSGYERKIHYERKLLYQLLQQVYQWKT